MKELGEWTNNSSTIPQPYPPSLLSSSLVAIKCSWNNQEHTTELVCPFFLTCFWSQTHFNMAKFIIRTWYLSLVQDEWALNESHKNTIVRSTYQTWPVGSICPTITSSPTVPTMILVFITTTLASSRATHAASGDRKIEGFSPQNIRQFIYGQFDRGMERRVSSLEDIESVHPPSASSHRRNSVTRYAEL